MVKRIVWKLADVRQLEDAVAWIESGPHIMQKNFKLDILKKIDELIKYPEKNSHDKYKQTTMAVSGLL